MLEGERERESAKNSRVGRFLGKSKVTHYEHVVHITPCVSAVWPTLGYIK